MFKPTKEEIIVDNYPYGRLRTKATFSLEFKEGKGFRLVFQTVNPKTGRINNPKKSTYQDIMLLDQNEEGFVKAKGYEIYHLEDVEKVSNLISENFSLFSVEEIKHIYGLFYNYFKITVIAMQTYCNSDAGTLSRLMGEATQKSVKGYNDPTLNIFKDIKIDVNAIKATEDKKFKPYSAN